MEIIAISFDVASLEVRLKPKSWHANLDTHIWIGFHAYFEPTNEGRGLTFYVVPWKSYVQFGIG